MSLSLTFGPALIKNAFTLIALGGTWVALFRCFVNTWKTSPQIFPFVSAVLVTKLAIIAQLICFCKLVSNTLRRLCEKAGALPYQLGQLAPWHRGKKNRPVFFLFRTGSSCKAASLRIDLHKWTTFLLCFCKEALFFSPALIRPTRVRLKLDEVERGVRVIRSCRQAKRSRILFNFSA